MGYKKNNETLMSKQIQLKNRHLPQGMLSQDRMQHIMMWQVVIPNFQLEYILFPTAV